MSYPTHITCRNGYFYYRIKIPVDLQPHFPTNFITKSFKTSDLSVAKAMSVNLEHAVQRVFTLLRTGMLDADMISKLISEILPTTRSKLVKTQPDIPAKKYPLSKMIKQYTEFKEPEWTPKTKLEMGGAFRFLLELLGDVDVTDITRQAVLDLRANLMRLPPNLHKRFLWSQWSCWPSK